MPKLHLDTDIGGDIDDLCALAMVLNWPDVELVAVTTVSGQQRQTGGLHALRPAISLAETISPSQPAQMLASDCYRV